MIEEKPERLLTRHGIVTKSGDLEFLDRDEFLKWVIKNRHRMKNGGEGLLEADMVLLYKMALSRAYAGHYHDLNERIPW